MNDTPAANVADILGKAAQTQGDRIALSDKAGQISYADLARQAGQVARQLADLGLIPGDRVAIIVDKRTEIVAAMFGCYRMGAILVPVNPLLKPRQIRHILADSGARALIAATRRGPILDEIGTDLALPVTISMQALLQPRLAGAALPPVREPAPGFGGLPLSTLFYTSGSTGLPKAVACTHDNVIAGADSVRSYLGNTDSDVLLAILPLSFDAGFSQLTTGLGAGARIVLQDYLLPADISRSCARHGVTGITGVPAIWSAALRANWSDEARHRLRYFANTGGHLPQERIGQLTALFPNARPFPMYGLTEAFRSSYLHPDMVQTKRGSIGKAIPGAVLCVVDDAGEECAAGQPGELVHAGPTVAAGYWNNPEETAKRFRPAPPALRRRGQTGTVVFSGDMVWRDAEGFLFYQGRRDAQIKIAGNRISFAEIEEVALAHPGVRACAAGGRATEPGSDPELILFLETDGSAEVESQVMDSLKADLPGFSVPSRIFSLRRLTVNANGKYDVARMIADCCNGTGQKGADGKD